MKETITLQQALQQINDGHLSQLKGLDENNITHVLNDAKEVILLTYHQNNQATPASVIKQNESEILENAGQAKGVFLQLVCGQGNDLSMDDMVVLDTVKDLFTGDTDFSWDVEHTESPSFKLRIDLFIISSL